jgi:pantoate--beta-alanine ligase
MLILETPAAMQAWSDEQRGQGKRVGLVPTMGDLHAGHVALIDLAATRCDALVVSVFVNPLQFNRRDDFDLYPRVLGEDIAKLEGHGVAGVYAPSQASMYPARFQTYVEPGGLAEPLEGAGRPGHFRGVATVVTKLFNAVRPHVVVFGQKDFQQLAVVRRMVADLDMGIEVVSHDTMREPDGLAMSSRNRRLTPEQRKAAVVVSQALYAVADRYADTCGRLPIDQLRAVGAAMIESEPLARLEYLDIVDADTLQPPTENHGPLVAVTAVWFGDVRLIDNVLL